MGLLSVWNSHGVNGFVVNVVCLDGKPSVRIFIWFVFVSGHGFLNFGWLMSFLVVSSITCFDFFLGPLYPCVVWIGPWYGWFFSESIECCGLEGKSRMVLGGYGYGGGHSRVLISCMVFHVGRRLCLCLAKAF